MGLISEAKKYFKREPVKPGDGDTQFTKIENLEQAANYLQSIKDRAARGDYKVDVQITTATSIERRAYLNYAISLMPDNLMQHKILLFLRVNPYFEDAATGREAYLSKCEIANALSKRIGRRVLEQEVDEKEREAVRYAMDVITTCREKRIPLVAGKF